MPVEVVTVTTLSCDNPDCPGHPDLDPNDRAGWLFISSEIYGEPAQQHVFGDADCAGAAATDTDSTFLKHAEPEELPESAPS